MDCSDLMGAKTAAGLIHAVVCFLKQNQNSISWASWSAYKDHNTHCMRALSSKWLPLCTMCVLPLFNHIVKPQPLEGTDRVFHESYESH